MEPKSKETAGRQLSCDYEIWTVETRAHSGEKHENQRPTEGTEEPKEIHCGGHLADH